MKTLLKIALVTYICTLLWLVLFKFSFDILAVITEHQSRSVSLVPFTGSTREMIDNFVVFVPLGLLLGAYFKRIIFWQKLIIVFVFSLSVEIIQFVFAIGITDITDLITNTLGGLVGLAAYALSSKYIDSKKIDGFIAITIMLLVALFLILRVFVLKVRY